MLTFMTTDVTVYYRFSFSVNKWYLYITMDDKVTR